MIFKVVKPGIGKTLVAVAAHLSLAVPVEAQRQYVSLDLGMGLQTLRHDAALSDDYTPGLGYTVNLGYTRFFSRYWGWGSGLGLALYQSHDEMIGTDRSSEIDAYNGGRNYYLLTTYRDWVERQQMLAAELPLGLYFRSNDPNCQFLFGFGGKLLLPVWNRYKVTDGSLETRGYYPDLNVELYNLPHHGFGVDNTHYKGSVDTRLGASLFIDMGFCQRLSYASSIYFGMYFNYGLTDVVDGKNVKLRDAEGNYNGLLASDQVDYVSPFSLGVKIGLSLYTGKKPPHQLKKIALPAVMVRSVDTVAVHDTQAVAEMLPVEPTAVAPVYPDSSLRKVMAMAEALPEWGSFSYMDMPLLNQADSAYQALTPAYKDSFPDTLSAKMETLDDHVTKATLSNLHELLLHYNFYIFDRDLAFCNLTSVEEEKLRQIADCVRMNPKIKLKVVGYACNEGSRSRAEMLSYERARYIREFILNCGVDPEQILLDNKVERVPSFTKNAESVRSMHRRVSLALQ